MSTPTSSRDIAHHRQVLQSRQQALKDVEKAWIEADENVAELQKQAADLAARRPNVPDAGVLADLDEAQAHVGIQLEAALTKKRQTSAEIDAARQAIRQTELEIEQLRRRVDYLRDEKIPMQRRLVRDLELRRIDAEARAASLAGTEAEERERLRNLIDGLQEIVGGEDQRTITMSPRPAR